MPSFKALKNLIKSMQKSKVATFSLALWFVIFHGFAAIAENIDVPEGKVIGFEVYMKDSDKLVKARQERLIDVKQLSEMSSGGAKILDTRIVHGEPYSSSVYLKNTVNEGHPVEYTEKYLSDMGIKKSDKIIIYCDGAISPILTRQLLATYAAFQQLYKLGYDVYELQPLEQTQKLNQEALLISMMEREKK